MISELSIDLENSTHTWTLSLAYRWKLDVEATADAAYPQHYTLPLIDWETAQKNDLEYNNLQCFLNSGNDQAIRLPHWFSILPSSKRSRFILEGSNILIKGEEPG